jgi:Mn-containing catalase
LHYFTQAFVLREKNPKMYDLFVDIAAEELSHLEMVGSMITMLLDGLDDDLKVATQRCDWLPAPARRSRASDSPGRGQPAVPGVERWRGEGERLDLRCRQARPGQACFNVSIYRRVALDRLRDG